MACASWLAIGTATGCIPMSLTLAEAAAACGVNKRTILRAVKGGKITGTRDDAGVWHVEPAELHPGIPARAQPRSTDAVPARSTRCTGRCPGCRARAADACPPETCGETVTTWRRAEAASERLAYLRRPYACRSAPDWSGQTVQRRRQRPVRARQRPAAADAAQPQRSLRHLALAAVDGVGRG